MVSTLKIYERAIEQALENNTAEQSQILATKEDVSKVREELKIALAEAKSEMVRWMFIFWLGQIAVLATLFKLLK